MADGTMGGKPGGSMLPPGFVDDKRREKDVAALDEAANKQDRVAEDKEDQQEEKRKKRVDALLPEKVESAYGEIT